MLLLHFVCGIFKASREFEMKKVAVVITHYNHEKYLPELLESINHQTYENWCLVVHDCCSRKTADPGDEIERLRKLVRQYIPADHQVYISRHPELAPIGVNRYEAVRQAGIIFEPDLVAVVDGDDVWVEDKLDLQVPLFKWDDRTKLVFSDCYYLAGQNVDEFTGHHAVHATTEQFQVLKRTFHDKYPPPEKSKDAFVKLLTNGNFMPCPTLMFDMQAWKKLIRPLNYTSAEDYDWVLRFARHHDVDWVKEPLAYYRLHPQQLTRRSPAHCTWEEMQVLQAWNEILTQEGEPWQLLVKLRLHQTWVAMKYYYKGRVEDNARAKGIAQTLQKGM